MLIAQRVTRFAAVGAALTLAAGLAGLIARPAPPARAAAPPASAGPSAAARASGAVRPSGTGIPAGAGTQISRELASAWQISRGGGVIVAVLDSGVASVSGLSGKLIVGPDYAPVANPVLTEGTVLASLIAGSGPSRGASTGSIGRAPAARILSERIVAYGSGTKAALKYQLDGTWQQIEARAIRYATDHGAKVIVCAESGAASYTSLASAVAYAISKNVAVITADFAFTADNSAQFPDALPGVINVSGTVVQGMPRPVKPGRFSSNYSVLVTAPANDLFGTGPGNQIYIGYNNDSAIAWAAGTAAMIKSVYPQISPALIARALAISASYHPAGGYNTQIGFGLINPIGALRAAGQLLKLRTAAAPGPAVASPGAHFGQGAVPGLVDAVRHSPVTLAGFTGAVVVGLAALAFAFLLLRRGRRSQPALAGAPVLAAQASTMVAGTAAAQPVADDTELAPPPPDQPAVLDRGDTAPPGGTPGPDGPDLPAGGFEPAV